MPKITSGAWRSHRRLPIAFIVWATVYTRGMDGTDVATVWCERFPAAAPSLEASRERSERGGHSHRSIHDLALAEAPVETIRRAFDRNHPKTLIGRITCGIAGNHNRISDLQRITRDACAAQLAGGRPLDVPILLFAVFVDDHDVEERVRIAKKKLRDLSLNGYRLRRIVGRSKRVMGRQRLRQKRSSK